MQAIQISLRNLKRSTHVSGRIQEKCEQLDRFHPHILYCRVAIAQESGRAGAAHPFNVTLRVGIPGREIFVATQAVHYYLALREAFATARRELKEAAAVRREARPRARELEATA